MRALALVVVLGTGCLPDTERRAEALLGGGAVCTWVDAGNTYKGVICIRAGQRFHCLKSRKSLVCAPTATAVPGEAR